MAEIPLVMAVLCDGTGNKLTGLPPLAVKSGRFVTTTMDTFPTSEAVFGADEAPSIQILAQNLGTTVKFYQRDVGLIFWGLVEDPTVDINDAGDTITVTLGNITDQMARNSVGLGAAFETSISSIVSQIGATYEKVPWTTFYSNVTPQATIDHFLAFGGDLTRDYNANGVLIGVSAGTGRVSPWSAAFVDDGTNIASATAVHWDRFVAPGLAINADGVAKLTSAARGYGDGAFSNQTIDQARDPAGNPVRSDGAFTFTAADVQGELLAGLGIPTSATFADIKYGWWLVASPTPGTANATGIAYPIVNGAQQHDGAGTLAQVAYQPGDRFTVAIDYTSGGPLVLWQINGDSVWPVTPVTPTLPLAPLCFLVQPGTAIQTPLLVNTVRTAQQTYAMVFDQQTPLEALLQLANATGTHVRQGVDAFGAPNQTLEVLAGGAQSGIRLTGGLEADLEKMLKNPKVRVVTSLNWKQETSKVINTVTPLGSGTGDAQVNLKRLYWILTNPTYPNYTLWGQKIGTVFPEYDPVNYPIQATLGRNGTWEYWVRDQHAFVSTGYELCGKYTDPQFSYTGDNVASQELVERALYIAAVAKLKWESVPNDTMTVECVGNFRPPRAGDRLYVDFRRIADSNAHGNATVMSTQARQNLRNPYVAMVERAVAEGGDIRDTYTLSFLPRQTQENANTGGASLRELEAIKIVPTNQVVYLPVFGQSDVDSNPNVEHSSIAQIRIPDEVFRVTSAPVDVQFYPLRQQVTTTDSTEANIFITIPDDLGITITTTTAHDDGSGQSHKINTLSGGTYDASKGFQTSLDPIAAMPTHFHRSAVIGAFTKFTVSSTPTTLTPDRYLAVQGDGNGDANGVGGMSLSANGHAGSIPTGSAIFGAVLDPSNHTHHAPVDQYVGVAKTLTGTLDTRTFTAPLPKHHHTLDTNLNDVAAPTLVEFDIDPGTGQFQQILDVADQNSGLVAQWSSSFYLPDVSKYVSKPGKLVRLRARSLTNSQNGIGNIRISGAWRCEIGGIGSTVFTSFQ